MANTITQLCPTGVGSYAPSNPATGYPTYPCWAIGNYGFSYEATSYSPGGWNVTSSGPTLTVTTPVDFSVLVTYSGTSDFQAIYWPSASESYVLASIAPLVFESAEAEGYPEWTSAITITQNDLSWPNLSFDSFNGVLLSELIVNFGDGNSSTYSPIGSPVVGDWQPYAAAYPYGQGQQNAQAFATIEHTYAGVGTYTLTITAIDTLGRQIPFTIVLTIWNFAVLVTDQIVYFTCLNAAGAPSYLVAPTAKVNYGDGFTDGGPGIDIFQETQTISHGYYAENTYTVTFTYIEVGAPTAGFPYYNTPFAATIIATVSVTTESATYGMALDKATSARNVPFIANDDIVVSGGLPAATRSIAISAPLTERGTIPGYKHPSMDQEISGVFDLLCYQVADGNAYLFQSADWCKTFTQIGAGAVWSQAGLTPPSNRANAQILALDGGGYLSSAVDTLGSNQAYIKFSPDGVDWSAPEQAVCAMTNQSRFWQIWQCVPAYSIRIFGSDGFYIYYSDDYGRTWDQLNTNPCWTDADISGTALLTGAAPACGTTADGTYFSCVCILGAAAGPPYGNGYYHQFRRSLDGMSWDASHTTFAGASGATGLQPMRLARCRQAYKAGSVRIIGGNAVQYASSASDDYGQTWEAA